MTRHLSFAIFFVAELVACHGSQKPERATADPETLDAATDLVVSIAGDDSSVDLDGTRLQFHALVAAFKTARPGTVRFEAPAATEWGMVISAIDAMKQAGRSVLSIAVKDDRARRSHSFSLPRATTHASGMAIVGVDGPMHGLTVTKDGAIFIDYKETTDLAASFAKLGDLHGGSVVIRADKRAPFGTVVDVAIAIQNAGSDLALGVATDMVPRSGE